ncbi:MAG: hemin uptake protein HemP [Candidatus Rokuibacteriota bacterium]|nr:MAG: hemin uptake protein HemP [Candidatus Rokubacteria bacterium]
MDDSAPTPEVRPVDRPRVVRTEELFGTRGEVIVKHGREEYRLRITRADKLLLTK